MHTDGPVIILLATYNGARFLDQQIRSIQRQSFTDWRLWVRDDGSTDSTSNVISTHTAIDPRIERIIDERGKLGVSGNFGILMDRARRRRAGCVMFADQDDVWRKHKIRNQYTMLRDLESLHGATMPILIHSDLRVVDSQLRSMHPSFMTCQHIRHEPMNPLQTLLVQNFVTGCTCLFNRALLDVAAPLPTHAVMHDWWVACCAGATGAIAFNPEQTVLYRQHEGNAIGARSYWQSIDPRSKSWMIRSPRATDAFVQTYKQACALRDRLASLDPGRSSLSYQTVAEYCRCFEPGTSTLQRFNTLQRLGVHRQDWIRQFFLQSRVLLMPALA